MNNKCFHEGDQKEPLEQREFKYSIQKGGFSDLTRLEPVDKFLSHHTDSICLPVERLYQEKSKKSFGTTKLNIPRKTGSEKKEEPFRYALIWHGFTVLTATVVLINLPTDACTDDLKSPQVLKDKSKIS